MEVHLLLPDNGLFHELLAEDYALIAPLQTFFYNGPRVPDDTAGHHEAFVVEVGHWNTNQLE